MYSTSSILLLLLGVKGLLGNPMANNVTEVEVSRKEVTGGEMIYYLDDSVPQGVTSSGSSTGTATGTSTSTGTATASTSSVTTATTTPAAPLAIRGAGVGLMKRYCAGNVNIVCDTEHDTASQDNCDRLVDQLYDHPDVNLKSDVTRVCFKDSSSNQECCLNWNQKVSLKQGELALAASSINTQCSQSGTAGKMLNAWIADRHCLTLCVANKSKTCK